MEGLGMLQHIFLPVCLSASEKNLHKCINTPLNNAIGTNNVLSFISVRILKTVTACPEPHPISIFGAESVPHRQCLTLQFHN